MTDRAALEELVARVEREMLEHANMALLIPPGNSKTIRRQAAAEWATILMALRAMPITPPIQAAESGLRETLFDAIAHGDEVHRAWLKEAIDNHFAGRPVPPPRERKADSGLLEEAVEIIRLYHGFATGKDTLNPALGPKFKDRVEALLAKAGKPGEAGNGEG